MKHEKTMWAKCNSYVVYYAVIHIRVQCMSVIYCGSNYEVNSSLIYCERYFAFCKGSAEFTYNSYFIYMISGYFVILSSVA